MQSYDEVDAICDFLSAFSGKFSVVPAEEKYLSMRVRHVKLKTLESVAEIKIPVVDEWKEVDKASPPLLLHMLLQTCEYFEESEDFEEWRIDSELPDVPLVKDIYNELEVITKEIRSIIGYKLEAVSDWDIQMNTGIAKKLRMMK